MAAEGASAAQEATPDGLVEVRLPTARTTSSTWLPISRRKKVAETGGGLTLLTCQTVRFFRLIPQDTCLSYCTRPLVCPAHVRARPYSQHDRLHRLIHRHVGGAEMPNDIFQNRLPRAGTCMCCPRRCSPPNSPLVPNPIRRPHRVLSILPLPRTPYALQDAAPAKCVEEVVF